MLTRILQITLASCALSGYAQSVEPLLGSMWRHQKDPFNIYCPIDSRTGERCQVGCVATACEEIMTYHGQSITLADTLHGWSTDYYTIPDVLPEQYLQCSNDDPEAIARLGYWCGVACHMNYGVGASGANIRRLVDPLHKAFGWKYAHHLDSYCYTLEKWRAIINYELTQGRPVLYAGYTSAMSGHAFVIDGVREDGLYHVNWGYGGYYDTHWYDLSELYYANPEYDRQPDDVTCGFFCNQEMLLLHYDEVENPLIADSLSRSGEEIAVSVALPESGIIAGQTCPVRFTLTNTSDTPLTTPFELFSNTPALTDSLFEKGDYAALFGATLNAGEKREITIPVSFTEPGERILRLSPDDEHIIWQSGIVTILPAQQTTLQCSAPVVHVAGTTATATISVKNPTPNVAGTSALFCLYEGDALPEVLDGSVNHIRYLYTPPNTSEQVSVDFRGLTPGAAYTLLVRQPWTPINPSGTTFSIPIIEGIDSATSDKQHIAPNHTIPLAPTNLIIQKGRKSLHRPHH